MRCSDGTIAKVAFYAASTDANGNTTSTLLGTATTAPYSFTWNSVAVGNYSLTAVATDNYGIRTTSAPISLTVKLGELLPYYIHTDHLDTPREITDTGGNVVWQWDNADPFGNNAPNENPGGLGKFEQPLRFPGQYADKETNLNYNINRNYDPMNGGRYIESDPIGLQGGINTYTYVRNNPLREIDPLGLVSLVGSVGGSFVKGFGGEGSIGFYITAPFIGGNNFDMGIYSSGGMGGGYNVALGGQLGGGIGNETDIAGISYNINGGISPIGGTVMLNSNGNPVGFTAGAAEEFGASVTYAETHAWGLNDLGTWLGGQLFDLFGPKQYPSSNHRPCP